MPKAEMGVARRVILTRSDADNVGLASELQRRGFEVRSLPLIEVTPSADGGAALRQAVANLNRYWAVTVTSANGIRALAEAMESVAGDRQWPSGVALAVVGPATGAVAQQQGWPVGLMPDTATAASLVAAFDDAPSPGTPVLAPLAQLASATVEDGLAAKGYRVDRVEAYRTREPKQIELSPADHPSSDDIVAFFSPSAVDRFADRFGSEMPKTAICIGPSTGARAGHRGFDSVLIAEPHSEAGVLNALGSLAR